MNITGVRQGLLGLWGSEQRAQNDDGFSRGEHTNVHGNPLGSARRALVHSSSASWFDKVLIERCALTGL